MFKFIWNLVFILLSLEIWAQDKAKVTLTHPENIRRLVGEVLEVAVNLPTGSEIEIPADAVIVQYNFRTEQGSVQRSSNGFFSQVKILSAPQNTLTSDEIAKLNASLGGLFLTATIQPNVSEEGEIPAVRSREINSDYLINFESNGKPKFQFTKIFQARFGKQLNRAIPADQVSTQDSVKWKAIMTELALAFDRTKPSPKKYLYINQADANYFSEAYERDGSISEFGAWSVAVKSTAPRHGFPNVPCAEFVSEIIRQAYKRAGYDVFQDFNDQKKNKLIWSNTAAVVNLAQALFIAGWIPWEMSAYKPIAGAPTMHARATSPGHAYISAGFDGRLIVDNGSPTGRDLGQTTDKIIKLMYLGGVFFLPPGMIPEKWDSAP